MKKKLIYMIVALLLIGGILVKIFYKPNMDSSLKDYLVKNGFHETEYTGLLEKIESTNQKNTFSMADYTYMMNFDDNYNDMKSSLNASYDFKEEKIVYSYRLEYLTLGNIYFKGNYDGEKFTCEKEFSNQIMDTKTRDNICNLAKINIEKFWIETKTLFSKYKFIDYIKNKKID